MLFTALQNRLLNFLQIGGFSATFLKITFNAASVGGKSSMQCAGINRHEAGNARVLREGSSEPLGPEFCVAHRKVFGEA
jgi:hypothetical protein